MRNQKITEHFLIHALKVVLSQYRYSILELHSDKGSEYRNGVVVELLNKLLIEFTKSRALHTNDQALVEGKNGSIIRKNMGNGTFPSRR